MAVGGIGKHGVVVIEPLLILFIFAFGACVGSFLNVVVYRMPRNESISFPPSHCPKCGKGIAWHDNIPIVSWLVLRGRCRHCGVKISPQYLLVEAATGLLVVGLYLAYFVFDVRAEAGALRLGGSLAMFIAHAALLCGLLACSLVDVKYFLVPLPVMWTVAIIGAGAGAVAPHPMLAHCSATNAALALAAGVGLLLAMWAVRKGWLPASMIDEEPPRPQAASAPPAATPVKNNRGRKNRRKKRGSVGATRESGINIRVEMVKEIQFLAPAFVLALTAWLLLQWHPGLSRWWHDLFNPALHPQLAPRLGSVGGALFGFLIGGLWIWGTRILGSLAFGREAMGMGDVHILAGVGAVTGWITPSLAFFLAPVAGLAFAIYLLLAKKRELPYGPWLALGSLLAMLLHDPIVAYLSAPLEMMLGR